MTVTVWATGQVMAFNDGFLLLGVTFVLAAPAILLLRTAKTPPPAGAGH